MKKSIYLKVMASLLLLMILVSCSMKSEEDAIEGAKKAAEDSFLSEETFMPNQELENISIYLPERLHVESEEPSNIILKDGNQTYIVFYNNYEPPTSEMGMNSSQNDEALLLHSFKDPDKFGYIRIMPETEKEYEMVVGVGGVKITTYTNRKKMEQDAEELMKITLSLIDQNNNDS